MSTHWRCRPSTVRALAAWARLVLRTVAAILAFIIAIYAIHGAATWTD